MGPAQKRVAVLAPGEARFIMKKPMQCILLKAYPIV